MENYATHKTPRKILNERCPQPKENFPEMITAT